MIGTALATLAMALVAMAPGIAFCRGMRPGTPLLAAMAAASLAVSLMATALAGIVVDLVAGTSLPAWTLLPVSLLLTGAAMAWRRGEPWNAARFEWPSLIPAAIAVLFAVYTYSVAIGELPSGALRVHAWYNADWFKHLGHAHALADYGIPARDIFASGRPLHYYWLIYTLPGAGAAVGGDVWTAMYVANLIFVALLFLVFHGVVRAVGLSPMAAAVAVLVASVAAAPLNLWVPVLLEGMHALEASNVVAPAEPPFTSFLFYVPQHAFAMTLLLGWAVTTIDETARRAPGARWAAVAAMTGLLTISTLFGAVLLGLYGLSELHRRQLKAVPELAAVAAVAGLLVLALGVVKLGDTHSALQSPAMANSPTDLPTLERAVRSLTFIMGKNGLPLVIAVLLAMKWKPESESERGGRDLALLLIAVAFAVAFAAEFVFGQRLSWEIRLRAANMPTVSIAIIGGYFASRAWATGGRSRLAAVLAAAALVALAMPSLVAANVWVGKRGDGYTTDIPRDDRRVLAALRAQSAPHDIVWQYPEKPFLSQLRGRDSWSAILAGRTNVATERATDYAAAYPDIERAYRYFAGDDVPVPGAADWIYLSRALHPESYDALVAKLDGPASGWTRRDCYPDACIFERDPLR